LLRIKLGPWREENEEAGEKYIENTFMICSA
jgi:hypothetical protein